MNLIKYVFLVITLIAFGVQFVYILSVKLTMSLMQKIVLFLIQNLSIIGFAHFYLLGQDIDKRKRGIKYTHIVLFLIYCVNLFYVLFLDRDFGRHAITMSYQDYLQFNVNLVPFETIMLFIRGYQRGVVSLETLLGNIIGNMVVFMPMTYFLLVFFKKQRKWHIFFITIIMIVLGVEILQVFLRIGSGDIDDLILNVIGAIIMFSIIRCFHLDELSEVSKGK